MFGNGQGDLDSISGRVIQKKKMGLNAYLLNTQHHKVQIKGKWRNPGKSVVLSPTFRKGSLRVTIDYDRQLNFIYIHIHIYTYIYVYIHIHIYIYRERFIYIYIYICIYACINIRIYTYTHTYIYE